MDLFTYLMAKNDHNTSVNRDLFSYLLGKGQSGTYQTFTGTSISANNTKKAKMKLDPKGNTSQTGTPTPDTPIPINVVSGDNEVVVCGKNLLNYIDNLRTNYGGLTSVINEDGSITTTGLPTSNYRSIVEYNINDILENGQTYIFWQETPQARVLYMQINAVRKDGGGTTYYTLQSGDAYKTFVAETNTYNYIINIQTETTSSWGGSSRTITNKYMLEKGSTKTDFVPYTSQTYKVDLPVENLFDNDLQDDLAHPNCTYSYVNGEIVVSATGSDCYLGEQTSVGQSWTSIKGQLIEVEPNTTYTYSITNLLFAKNFVVFYDSNKVSTKSNYIRQATYTFTTESTTKYISMRIGNENSVSGTTYKLNVMLEKGSKMNSYTPYGTTPIELCKIGTYQDYFTKNSGKNLWNEQWENGYWNRTTGEKGSGNEYLRCKDYQPITPNTDIYFTKPSEYDNYAVLFYDSDKNKLGGTTSTETQSKKFTAPANAYYFTFYCALTSGTATYKNNIMLNEGTTALPYEPYGTGQWCKYNAIGEVALDGSEDEGWWLQSGIQFRMALANTIAYSDMYSNYFIRSENTTDGTMLIYNAGYLRVYRDCNSLSAFKTWLSTHNTEIYYPLQTPYLSLIEDTTLIEQLDNIQNAMSYKGTTNISQVNNDLPFEMEAEIKVSS